MHEDSRCEALTCRAAIAAGSPVGKAPGGRRAFPPKQLFVAPMRTGRASRRRSSRIWSHRRGETRDGGEGWHKDGMPSLCRPYAVLMPPIATPSMPTGIPGPRRVRAPRSRHAKPLSAAQPPLARTRIRRIVGRAPDRVLRGLRICRSGLPKRWRSLARQADLAHADLGLTAKTARSGTDRVLCIGFRSPKDRLRELRRKRPAEMPLTDHIDPLQAIHKTQSLPVSALFSAKPRLTEKMLIRGGF